MLMGRFKVLSEAKHLSFAFFSKTKQINTTYIIFLIMNQFLTLVIVSTIAGMATVLGGLIVIIKRPGRKRIGLFGGFAGGVMITVAFMDLLGESIKTSNYLTATIGFGIGALFMFLLDILLSHKHFEVKEKGLINPGLVKVGMLMAIGVALHNIPEGIAVGAGFAHLPKFGILLAIAIGLHNIPEGIATTMFTHCGGKCKRDCLKIAFLSGIVEPIGAILAYLFLKQFTFLIPVSLAFAAGVMVFITLDEIIPMAREHGRAHLTSIGIILGTIFMIILHGIMA